MSNWLKRLFGGSESSASDAPEAATAPEPSTMPSEPPAPPADAGTAPGEPAGDEPA